MSAVSGIKLDTVNVGEISGNFYVPSYQRGYRWESLEVTRLLNDIYKNGRQSYCLQPVVVGKSDSSYHMIDGQQRLTTVYLIYKYMHDTIPMLYEEPAFSLTYETRKETADYLKSIEPARACENIDFWFISNAYNEIKNWFEHHTEKKSVLIPIMAECLEKHVKVIWYEVPAENGVGIPLFTRLNIGKIPLTSAELVKALFLSESGRGKLSSDRQKEIAQEWDNIERELHGSALWGFLTDGKSDTYQTRIDLVLDLIAEKPEDSREKYYTFFKFDEKKAGQDLEDIWEKDILHTFLILKDWFEDREFYHKIGYLIAVGTPLKEIFDSSRGVRKSEFKKKLDTLIKESIDIKGRNYSELSYEKAADYRAISKLLLLFNVMSTEQNKTQRFPFDKFKSTGGVTWSLEHIHAQQSEGLGNKTEVQKKWLEMHLSHIQAAEGCEALAERIKAAVKAAYEKKLTGDEFERIREEVERKLSPPGEIGYLHTVANLALLKSDDNAALNNSTFAVKRDEIIKLDKNGEYIPLCTRNVFLKYYTPSGLNQILFWSPDDRKEYIAEINKVLAPWLGEPISTGEEESV